MQIQTRPYLTTLTPLRGIAAMLVVIFHCNLMLQTFLPPGYTKFVARSFIWVDFFFVLSGFIMCYAYGKYFENGFNKSAFKKYLGSRLARVFPLNSFTALWAFVCSVIIVHYATKLDPFLAAMFNPKALPACLLLVQSMHIGYFTPPLNTPSWSLSTEWWVYVIFPFIVPLFIGLKKNGKITALLLIITFYFVLRYVIGPLSYGHPRPTIDVLTDFGFLRCLAGFLLGMLVFTFYENRSGFNIIRKDWFFLVSFIGLIAGMHFGAWDIMLVAFFPFILISAAYNQTFVKRVLDAKPLQRLGDWSFTIYMVHVPIIYTFFIFRLHDNRALFEHLTKAQKEPDYIHGLIMCLSTIIITLIAAALIYRFIEVPSRNYINKVFHTKRKPVSVKDLKV